MFDYDWRSPITVENPKNKSGVSVERKSFKWFNYWLEHDCTYKQVADEFKTSTNNIEVIASLFKWQERKKNREEYLSRQRDKALIDNYTAFIETDFKNSEQMLLGVYNLVEMAFIVLNILPNTNNKTGGVKFNIPAELGVKEALEIVKSYPKTAKSLHSQILRDLQQPDKINDKQEHEVNADMDVKTDVTVNLLEKVKQKRKELNDLNKQKVN